MTDAKKHLVFGILKYLEDQQRSESLSEDAKESIEVASQCLEAVYDVFRSDEALAARLPLPEGGLQEIFDAGVQKLELKPPPKKAVSDSDKMEADKHKARGNELMKEEKFEDALKCYNDAISIDDNNAVYFCNRAAAHSKLQDHRAALSDCMAALAIDPNYNKAYGRRGLAHTALNQHEEARIAYKRALELDPNNESYKIYLEQAEAKCREQASATAFGEGMNLGNMDFAQLLNNPALMSMATNMMANPQMQQIVSSIMQQSTAGGEGGMSQFMQAMANMMGGGLGGGLGGGMGPVDPPAPGGAPAGAPAGMPNFEAMMQAGQQLAEQMRETNPELIDQLRREVNRGGQGPQDPQNPQDPPPGTT